MGLLASEKWHLFVLHKHVPLKFSPSQEVHTRALPWVDEYLISEIAPYVSLVKQWPQLILGSVEKKK